MKLKNDECTISIITKHGSKQNFRKAKNGWIQISSKGIIRCCNAEQVLSHFLPPSAFGRDTLKVEPDRKEEKQ